MEQFVTFEAVKALLGIIGLASSVVALALGIKKLFGKRESQWPIHRREYDKDDVTRKEQLARIESKCDSVEAASEKRHDDHLRQIGDVIKALNLLEREVASLTGHLRSSCPGGSACRMPSPPPLPQPRS